MVNQNFTYNGVSYIGYSSVSLYTRFDNTSKILQFWGYKSADDVDTIYITIETIIASGIAVLTAN